MKNKKWIKVKDEMPDEGVLCIVYFPIGKNMLTENTTGPSAMALYRQKEGWVYADTPRKLNFKPYYWQPFIL